MNELYDVVVIGAGPGGLITARELAKFGHSVLLIEAKKSIENITYHTLGSFADPKDFDLSQDCIAQKISSCRFYTDTKVVEKQGSGNIFNKLILHKELYDQCLGYGVKMAFGELVIGLQKDAQQNISSITSKKGLSILAHRGKIFVDATGIQATLGKIMGLTPKNRVLGLGIEYDVEILKSPETGHLFVGKEFDDGYGWIVATGSTKGIAGWAVPQQKFQKKLTPHIEWMLSHKNIKCFIGQKGLKIRGGAIPMDGPFNKFGVANLVLVGDAAGQVNPVVGEGYRFILNSGMFAGRAISEKLSQNIFTAHKSYQKLWDHKYRGSYRRIVYTRKFLRSLKPFGFSPKVIIFVIKYLPRRIIQKLLSGKL